MDDDFLQSANITDVLSHTVCFENASEKRQVRITNAYFFPEVSEKNLLLPLLRKT